MKNQYFGDINDYKKYGLLRSIFKASNLKILIAWMPTKDDGSTDGKFIEYLSDPEKWEKYDPELYREISVLLKQNSKREVNLIESSNILNGSQYFSTLITDEAVDRISWFFDLKTASQNCDLVFLDPDNGLEIKSVPYGRKKSSKFLYWEEVSSLWSAGKSLLIYQHFIREKRELFIERMLNSLAEKTEDSVVGAFSTSNVLFLLALQPEHHKFHTPIVNSVQTAWPGQILCSKIEHPCIT